MDFKSLFDSLDKITDILNLGRLIFYTAAGFLGVLPVGMSLRVLAQDQAHTPLDPYWTQFLRDATACSRSIDAWLAALVFGFVIATVANALVEFPPAPRKTINHDSYDYNYPRLFSGGGLGGKQETPKDYAAWLISEYYRYLEIVWFIPYGMMLSLPVYALYSLIYLVRTLARPESLALNAAHLAFGLWTAAAVVVWTVVWPWFWMPRVLEPTYKSWVDARRAAIAGLNDFVHEAQSASRSEKEGKKQE